MKRHRVIFLDFDMRANVLALEIKDDWAPNVREAHMKAREQTLAGLRFEIGDALFEQKAKNFIELGASPMSLVAFHNAFFHQARMAFVMACYYPALTAVSALGERILNHLIRVLREDYKTTPEYAEVSGKKSFSNWETPIRVLETWNVLIPEAARLFRKLRDIRNRSLHFNLGIEHDVRPHALEAIKTTQQILSEQFASFGPQPWYIRSDTGISFVRKESESHPFVKRIVLPNCAHVGPAHDMGPLPDGTWRVVDRDDYLPEEIDDEEYVRLFKEAHRTAPPASPADPETSPPRATIPDVTHAPLPKAD